MPAQTKYLSSTPQRIAKITAAIFGGYIVAMAIHIAIGAVLENKAPLLLTSAFSAFFLWVFFMIVSFLMKKAWQVWALFACITIVCSICIIIFK
ncbi:MAG: hypothetical protein AAGI07_04455 [Bacteroidota bacterium]